MTTPKTPRDVLSFWFGEPARDVEALKAKMRRWFGADPELDETIERAFGREIEAALEGKLDAWRKEPKGWLALVILLDQLTRNAYRGDPKTHAGDAQARELTRKALEDGSLRALPFEERHFALMPLLHAEDLDSQARFAEELTLLLETVPAELKPIYESAREQSEKYTEIIRRFGRFPHRNALLGRRSTPEEEAFLVDWQAKAAPQTAREMGFASKPHT